MTSYTIASAQLTLQHNFPRMSEVKAVVDVRRVLARLTAEHTSVGQWVNVIGYVASSRPSPAIQSSKRKRDASSVEIQALMLWSAGPLDIGRYERCLAALTDRNGLGTKRQKTKAD